MKIKNRTHCQWASRVAGLIAFASVLVIACGASSPATPQPTSTQAPAQQATAAPRAGVTPGPTAAVQAAPTPTAVRSAKDKVVFVTNDEPLSLNAWTTKCSSNLVGSMCNDTVNEPFTWVDSKTFEVVPLSGTESWQQIDPNRWRFKLRPGVKFHNGEPWNAETAKVGLDINGDSTNGLDSFSFSGALTGQVVDELTVDVVCKDPCPILPRGLIFSRFQAPQWYKSASDEQRARRVVGIGPYKVVDWRPGIDIRLEAYENYVPNKAVDAQAPVIKNAVQVWRGEGLVRAAMVSTGEADWAMDIGFDNLKNVPAFKQSGTTEVYALVLDTMWHPELKKQKVRKALAHAIDCKAIVTALYGGRVDCIGNISVLGTVGVTPKNYAPYEYNPDLARQLLKEAGYDPANQITIYVLANRVYRDVEFQEAVARYWTQVGVNAKLQVLELARYTDIRSSGCGKFTKEPGYAEKLDCASRPPPGPNFATSHAITTSTSNEALDMSVQATRRMGCFNVNSRVCYPELQRKIEAAVATSSGPERTLKMEEIANIAHDEVYFLPFFHNQLVYGVSKNLVWEPLYAPRLRVNTMRFAP